MAGMEKNELNEFGLSEYSVQDLGLIKETHPNSEKTKTRFCAWKKSLGQLGIPLPDIMRVLAAVVLMGNMSYEGKADHCVGTVARLLGVEQDCLVDGLWRKSHLVNGTLFKRNLDEKEWELARAGLACSLYMRTIHIIIRRVNTHPPPLCSGKNVLATSFIGILDMFGWQTSLQSAGNLEQLCMNLCSESLQLLYNRNNTITMEDSDSPTCNQLLAPLDCGLLKWVDRETQGRGDSQSLVNRIHEMQRTNQKLFVPERSHSYCFGIHHFAGPVVYDASLFIGEQRNLN